MKKYLKILSALIFTIGIAHAADPVTTPDGTFTLEIEAISLYSGDRATPISKGVVTYKGKNYPFNVSAVSMGNRFGESTLKANGVIYGMTEISQFEGAYHVTNSSNSSQGSGNKLVTFINNNGITLLMNANQNGPFWVPSTGAIVKLAK